MFAARKAWIGGITSYLRRCIIFSIERVLSIRTNQASSKKPIEMHLLRSLFLLALPVLSSAGTSRRACQESSEDPLAGCKSGVIVVSPDHPKANFKTIQSAIDSLDDESDATILILSGEYKGQLNISRSGPLSLLGQTDYSISQANNTVTVINAAANVDGRYNSNSDTATLKINPSGRTDRLLPLNSAELN